MTKHGAVKAQVDSIIAYLVEVGLAGDQNFAVQRTGAGGMVEITFPHAEHMSVALRDRAYQEIYDHLEHERAYSVKLPDGALIQMMYIFAGGNIERHRLAFYPSPHLEEFQGNPDIYMEDAIYADIVAKNIVPFPVRFDYDSRDDVYIEIDHARSHLTLGQYENCRIPVTAPLMPFWFIDFILRNFYNTAYRRYADDLPKFADMFAECISASERSVVHVQIPK